MNYEKKQEIKRKVLKQLYDTGKIDESLSELSQAEYAYLLKELQDDNFISGIRFTNTKTTPVFWCDKARLTNEGANFINPSKKKVANTTVYNIQGGDMRGSAFGNDNVVTNNWSNSIKDLKDFIATLPMEDQKTGSEIVEIIEKKEIKPGVFNKFTDFLEKHPNVVGMLGNAVVWALSMHQ